MNRFLSLLFFSLALFSLAGCSAAATTPVSTPGTSSLVTSGQEYTNISPAQLQAALQHKDFVLINVHIPYEGELPNTDAFVPYNAIAQNLGQLPADPHARIVLYCRSGRMSTLAAQELVKRGYTNVLNLEGGMLAWQNAGYPLIRK